MFEKLLGKAKDNTSEDEKLHAIIVDKVSKMTITDMRVYVNNRLSGFEITEDGLIEVMKKLTIPDKKTENLYLRIDDMDSKKKKAFELVIVIAKSKKISIKVVELIQEFTLLYEALIQKFDMDYKEIYSSRLKDVIAHALSNLNEITELKRKMNVLGE